MNIKEIEYLIGSYAPKIGLADWTITARRPNKGETTHRAFVISDPIQLWADTAWDLTHPDWKTASDTERERVILHELCHILFSRYSQVAHDIIQEETDETIRDHLIARIDDQEESICGKLSAVFHQLMKGDQ